MGRASAWLRKITPSTIRPMPNKLRKRERSILVPPSCKHIQIKSEVWSCDDGATIKVALGARAISRYDLHPIAFLRQRITMIGHSNCEGSSSSQTTLSPRRAHEHN
jgi:hypothetical protein